MGRASLFYSLYVRNKQFFKTVFKNGFIKEKQLETSLLCLELPCYKKLFPKPRILLQNGFGLKWKRISFATNHGGDFQILVFLPILFSREIKQTAFYKEKLFLVTCTFPALSKAFLLIIFRVQRKRRKRKKRRLMRTNGRNHSFEEFIIESPGYIMLTIQSEIYTKYCVK